MSEIGLSSSTVKQGVTLGMAEMLKFFQIFGNVLDLKDSLKISTKRIAKNPAKILRILTCGSLGPGALLVCRLLNFLLISVIEHSLILMTVLCL